GAAVRRPVGGGGGRVAGAVAGHRLPRMDLRPCLAGGRPGRQIRKRVRQIGRAARMISRQLNRSQAMPAASRSLKDLFLAAVEVPPEQRAAWLQRECAGDAALGKQVALLLAAHDTPQSLLDHPEPAAAATGECAIPEGEGAATANCEEAGTVLG